MKLQNQRRLIQMFTTDISVDEETKIEDISENLYKRIQEETEAHLKIQEPSPAELRDWIHERHDLNFQNKTNY